MSAENKLQGLLLLWNLNQLFFALAKKVTRKISSRYFQIGLLRGANGNTLHANREACIGCIESLNTQVCFIWCISMSKMGKVFNVYALYSDSAFAHFVLLAFWPPRTMKFFQAFITCKVQLRAFKVTFDILPKHHFQMFSIEMDILSGNISTLIINVSAPTH